MPPPPRPSTPAPWTPAAGGGDGLGAVSFKEIDDGDQRHRIFRKTPYPSKKPPAASSTQGQENNTPVGPLLFFAPRTLLEGKGEAEQQQMAPAATGGFPPSDAGPGHLGRSRVLGRLLDGAPAKGRSGEDEDAATATTASISAATADETMATMTTAEDQDFPALGPNPTDNSQDDEGLMEDVDIEAGNAEAAAVAEAPDSSAAVTEEAWQQFCDTLEAKEPPQSASRRNLEAFRQAREVREQSRRRLEGALERGLGLGGGGCLASEVSAAVDRVASSRDDWLASNARLGSDAVQWAQDNHERRGRFVRQVHDSFSHVEKACRGLVSRVMDEASTLCGAPPGGGGTDPSAADNKTSDKDSDDSMLVDEIEPATAANQASGSKDGALGAGSAATADALQAEGEGGGKPTDPDWDSLLSFEPMRECTKTLMDTKAFLGQVDEHLSTTVTSLTGTLQECRDNLEAFAVGNYNMVSDALNAQEDEIQAEMVRNLERRIDFEVAVRQQAEQSQSFFHSLMRNIRTAFHGGAGGDGAAAPPDSSGSGKRAEPGA